MREKKVKTIKGFIGLIRQVAKQDVEDLKGYDKLSESQKKTLSFIRGEAYNSIGELETFNPPLTT